MAEFSGGCLCGAVRYEVNGELVRVAQCHCDDCRRATGSAFATNVFVNEEDLRVLHGETTTFQHSADSGSTMTKEFCGKCGSPIYSAVPSTPDIFYLKLGTMNDTSYFSPQFHVFCGSKQHWVELDDTVPSSQKMENFG